MQTILQIVDEPLNTVLEWKELVRKKNGDSGNA